MGPSDDLARLRSYMQGCRRAVLLFSGGLDSSLLLAVGVETLGPGFTAVTFAGPHLPPGELAAAWALARRHRVRHLIREFDPLGVPDFQQNSPERCYDCKKTIIRQAWKIAGVCGAEALWDGTNLDDLGHFRPGLRAVKESGVGSPLQEAGLDKAAIRDLSRTLGLDWRKPAQSCLATRFPYGTRLTREALGRVGRAEAWLRRRGFTHVRLRVDQDRARLELAPEEWPGFLSPWVRRPFASLVHRLGWRLEEVGGGG